MNNIPAVILAAGRGSRLKNYTENCPKGLVNLNGHALVEWQIANLQRAGVRDIHIVTGYLSEHFDYLKLPTVYNAEWSNTNMVASLMCFVENYQGPLLVSYSDIIYPPSAVTGLLDETSDISISYDLNWLELWAQRFDDPLDDAETFRVTKDYKIKEIGNKPAKVSDVQGQFMGLIYFSAEGIDIVKQLLRGDDYKRKHLDMTALLNECLAAGHLVSGRPFSGSWYEIDSESDLEIAERQIKHRKLDLVVPEMRKT